jgi:hypothetical protein
MRSWFVHACFVSDAEKLGEKNGESLTERVGELQLHDRLVKGHGTPLYKYSCPSLTIHDSQM